MHDIPRVPGPELPAPGTTEFDREADVEAAVVTQRRVAVGYALVFLLVTLSIPALNILVGWWTQSRLIGGLSPAFAMVAAGLYAFFLFLGIAAARLTDAVEARMLGEGLEPRGDRHAGSAP